MIGPRVWIGMATALAIGAVFSQRPALMPDADPPRAAALAEQAVEAAQDAEQALVRLEAELRAAVDDARRAAAATRSGADLPGARFVAAADRVEASGVALDEVHATSDRLAGVLASLTPPREPPPPPIAAAELGDAAEGLRNAAGAADAFTQMRLATDTALVELERALTALEADDLVAAEAALGAAGDALRDVAAWEAALPTLPLWVATADGLVEAANAVVEARRAGDELALQAAGAAYADAAQEARLADRALAVALADGGASVAAEPLSRLALALARVEEARVAMASLVHDLERPTR